MGARCRHRSSPRAAGKYAPVLEAHECTQSTSVTRLINRPSAGFITSNTSKGCAEDADALCKEHIASLGGLMSRHDAYTAPALSIRIAVDDTNSAYGAAQPSLGTEAFLGMRALRSRGFLSKKSHTTRRGASNPRRVTETCRPESTSPPRMRRRSIVQCLKYKPSALQSTLYTLVIYTIKHPK